MLWIVIWIHCARIGLTEWGNSPRPDGCLQKLLRCWFRILYKWKHQLILFKLWETETKVPNLKLGVLKVGHVNSRGNTMWIGIGTFRITLPVPIWMFCISVAATKSELYFKKVCKYKNFNTILRVSFSTAACFNSNQLDFNCFYPFFT